MTFATNNSPTAWETYTSQARAAYINGRYAETERLLSSALKVAEQFGENDGRLLESLKSIAGFYAARGEWGIAENMFARAVSIGNKTLGAHHLETVELQQKLDAVQKKRKLGQTPPAINWF